MKQPSIFVYQGKEGRTQDGDGVSTTKKKILPPNSIKERESLFCNNSGKEKGFCSFFAQTDVKRSAGGSQPILQVHTSCGAFLWSVLRLRRHPRSSLSPSQFEGVTPCVGSVTTIRATANTAQIMFCKYRKAVLAQPVSAVPVISWTTACASTAVSLKPTPWTPPIVHVSLAKSQLSPCAPGKVALALAWQPLCSTLVLTPKTCCRGSPPLPISSGPCPQPQWGADGRHKGKPITPSPVETAPLG